MPARSIVSTDIDPLKLSLLEVAHLDNAQRRMVRKQHGGSKTYRSHKRATIETVRRKIKVPRKQAGLPVRPATVRASFARTATVYSVSADDILLALLPRSLARAKTAAAALPDGPVQKLGARRRAAAQSNKKQLKRLLRQIEWPHAIEFLKDAPFEITHRGDPRRTMGIRLLPHIGGALIPANTPEVRKSLEAIGMRVVKPGKVRLIAPERLADKRHGGDAGPPAHGRSAAVTASGRGPKLKSRTARSSAPMIDQYASFGLAAKDVGRGGAGVVIGVLDTGVVATHEQFAGKTVHEVEIGVDGSQKDVTPHVHHHGTSVAALAAGNTGVAAEATLLSAKVLTGPDGDGEIVQVIAGIEWILEYAAAHYEDMPVVIVASLGTDDEALQIDLETEIFAQQREESATLFAVAAAGNDGAHRKVEYPAAMEEFIAVGALDAGGAVWGGTHRAGAGVDIFALGVGTESADIWSPMAYGAFTGTSMATPLVGGVLARLIASDPTGWAGKPIADAVSKICDPTTRHLTIPPNI